MRDLLRFVAWLFRESELRWFAELIVLAIGMAVGGFAVWFFT